MKSKPIQKLEQVVIEALESRGFSRGEAQSAVERLESLADKPGATTISQQEWNEKERTYHHDNYAREEAGRQRQEYRREYEYHYTSSHAVNSTWGKYKVVSHVVCTVETADAIFIKVSGKGVWVPKSQMARDSQVRHRGDVGDLKITEWLYNKRQWR